MKYLENIFSVLLFLSIKLYHNALSMKKFFPYFPPHTFVVF